MKVFVIGGAGYIGGITASELIRHGHDVVVLDNLSRGYRDAVPEGASFEQMDLADQARLDALFGQYKPDGVIHFAAYIEVGESMKYPAMFFRNNVVHTLNLLEAMVAHDCKRIVFSSTAAVYGFPETVPVPEDAPLRPINPYGRTKLMMEEMMEWFDKIHDIRYAALRYFNAAGAWEGRGEAHNPETHLIPLILQVALGKRSHINIYGDDYPTPDGTAVRDYIHVADLATAHILALQALDGGSRTYNVGTGQGFSVQEVIEAARTVTGHSIPAVVTPRRAGDSPQLVAANEKIMRELGWEPRYSDLDTIVRSAWEWHQSRPNGYDEE
jgi:UDP-glucose 4-epimerase